MCNKIRKIGIVWLIAIAISAFLAGAITFSPFVAKAEETDVTAVYKDGSTDKKSENLEALEIKRFSSLTTFTDYFKLGYKNSSDEIASFVSLTEEGDSVKIDATSKKVHFRLVPDNNTGFAKLGNFEIKITLKNLNKASGGHIYFGSRRDWDSTDMESGGNRAILNAGSNLQSWGSVTSVKTGANGTVADEFTLTVSFIDNAWYFYKVDRLNADASDCSVYKANSAFSTSAGTTRSGAEVFDITVLQGATFEISYFSYKRISEFDASVSPDASAEKVLERVASLASGRKAVFTDGAAKTSANLQSISIAEFENIYDFTDYFKPSYNQRNDNINDFVTYDEADKSIIISASEADISGNGGEWRLMPDGSYGKSELGNFEMTFTIKLLNAASGRNVYFGSRQTWDTSNYTDSPIKLTGKDGGIVVSQMKTFTSEENLAGITVTFGFVNGVYYYKTGAVADNNNAYGTTKTFAANSNATRDGNQCFAIALTKGTQIKISSIYYKRLEKSFDFNEATTDTLAYLENLIVTETLEAQKPVMGYGATIRIDEPVGLRFSTSALKQYADGWKEKGYTVSLGMIVAISDNVTEEKGALTLDNENYILDTDYRYIEYEADETNFTLRDGKYLVNGVLKVKESNFSREYIGVAYLKIEKDGNVRYVYAESNDNVRSAKDVAAAALNDSSAVWSDDQIKGLKRIAGII